MDYNHLSPQLLPADAKTLCACVNHPGNITHVNPRCAYLNLRVPELGADDRVKACVCGDCVLDEPSYDDGPYLKEICVNCSMDYLQILSKIARLVARRLATRVTVDNYFHSRDETVALRAIEEWAGEDAGVFNCNEYDQL